jgi:hypothetical protein
LRKEIREKDQEIEDRQAEIENLQEEQLKHIGSPEVADLARKGNDLRNLCKVLIKDKRDLRRQLKKAQSTIGKLETQVYNLKRKLTQAERERDEQADQFRRQLAQTGKERDENAERVAKLQLIIGQQDAATRENLTLPRQKTSGQEHQHSSYSRSSIPEEGNRNQTTASHRRKSSGSKHSHSNKNETRVVGSYLNVFGRIVKQERISQSKYNPGK